MNTLHTLRVFTLNALLYGLIFQCHAMSPSPDTALLQAAASGITQDAQKAIDNGANVNIISIEGKTALNQAIANGYIDIVKLLIGKKEININQEDDAGYTALILARELNQQDVVQLLLDKGATEKLSDPSRTLVSAAYDGYAATVQQALKQGANVNAQDGLGNSALATAINKGYLNIVEILLNNDATVTPNDLRRALGIK